MRQVLPLRPLPSSPHASFFGGLSPFRTCLRVVVAWGAATWALPGCVDAAPIDCHGPSPHASCDEVPAGGAGAPSAGTGGEPGAEGSGGGGAGPVQPARTRVVGYLPTYRSLDPAGVNLSALTHLCIAFANPGPVGGSDEPVFDADDTEIDALVAAAHAAGVQVLASIAGAAGSDRVAARITEDKVDGFVDALLGLVERFDLDGIDVDIEGTTHVTSTYEPFVKKLGAALRADGKLMTSAVGLWYGPNITKAALDEFDFINVMSYDHCGSWSPSPCEHSTMASARSDMNYWVTTRGYPADRTVLGVPFYGYCWGTACESSALTYAAILSRWSDAASKDWIEEEGLSLSYNGEATLRSKTALAKEHGGIMIWELGQDAPGEASLLSVIADEL